MTSLQEIVDLLEKEKPCTKGYIQTDTGCEKRRYSVKRYEYLWIQPEAFWDEAENIDILKMDDVVRFLRDNDYFNYVTSRHGLKRNNKNGVFATKRENIPAQER